MDVKKYSSLIFSLLFLIVCFIYKLQISIKHPPSSTHQWRQADGLSMTKNYYEEGMHFFDPKIHFQDSKEGRAVGEFPIIYYINAIIWKITGPNYITFRLLNLVIVFLGLFALFKLCLSLFNNLFYSLFIPLFLFSSPLFGFYSNNFLVNLPAVCIVFIGWYQLYQFHVFQKTKHLYFSILLFSLAVLLRPTMLIGILPIYILIAFDKIGFLKQRIFQSKKYFLLFIPLLILVVWILYSKNYNSINGSIYYLTTIRPIWESTDISGIWERFIRIVVPEFYNLKILTILLLFFVSFFFFWKRVGSYTIIFTSIILIQIVCFILLWYNNLNVHDYYLIDFYLIIPSILFGVFKLIESFNLAKKSIFVQIGFTLLLVFSFFYGTAKTRIKYFENETFVSRNFIDADEHKFWEWYHWDYKNRLEAVETIQPYLRKIGLKRTDKVLSIPDISPNVTLFFMDQKGYTSLYNESKPIKDLIEESIKKGVKYLIINDPNLLKDTSFQSYLNNKIGSYYNVSIFSLK